MSIIIENISYKNSHNVSSSTAYHAEIELGKSIRLYGTHYGSRFSNSFNIGDMAEYNSYNMSYYGEIIKITAKTVTIKEKYSSTTHRLSLYEFAWRNQDFNLNSAQKRNSEWSD